jgi:hypothetical protein
MNLRIITIISIFSFSGAQATQRKPKAFGAEQFNHQNVGCPMNSNCSKKVGNTYKEWKAALSKSRKKKNQVSILNQLAQKNGLPFTQWVTNRGSFSEELIVWDSHCRNHNKEGRPKIHIGLQFINNLSQTTQLEKDGMTHNRFMLVLDQMGRITERIVPRSDTPLYFDGDNLIYQIEFEGNYFSQSLTKKGEMRVVESITPKEFPKTIDCPKNLLNVASKKKEKLNQDLYLGFFCQRTWDKQTGSSNIILLPWSCN